jgi:excisionase family DNA binding protein
VSNAGRRNDARILAQDADGAQRRLLRPREAAALLAIGTRTLWSLTASGAIPAIRIGKCLRYAHADLEQYVAANRQERTR